MSRSKYSLMGLMLNKRGLPIPHGEDEFYPSGYINVFDQNVMLGWYASPTYYRAIDDTETATEALSQEERKVLSDEIRLADWIDVDHERNQWIDAPTNLTVWTES